MSDRKFRFDLKNSDQITAKDKDGNLICEKNIILFEHSISHIIKHQDLSLTIETRSGIVIDIKDSKRCSALISFIERPVDI